jgi:hypothetical protein
MGLLLERADPLLSISFRIDSRRAASNVDRAA